MIAEHRDYLAKINDAEAAAKEQRELAERLERSLAQELAMLMDFEFEVQPSAARRLGRAAEMCRQMADAITAFMAPRFADYVVTQNQAGTSDRPTCK